MKQSWETDGTDGRPYFINISPPEVVVGEGSPPNDYAATCTYEEFLKGQFQSDIEAHFGKKVLDEVIQAVLQLPQTEIFRKFYEKEQRMLNFLNAIPLDKELAIFADHDKIEEHGYSNYGNGKKFHSQSGTILERSTRLVSDNLTLVYGLTDHLAGKKVQVHTAVGFLSNNAGTTEKEIRVGIQPDEGIAWRDYFYLSSGQTFVVINPEGNIISNEIEMKLFGNRVRIERVWRIGDTVCFFYQWFHRNHPGGVLYFDPRIKRFTKHWLFQEKA